METTPTDCSVVIAEPQQNNNIKKDTECCYDCYERFGVPIVYFFAVIFCCPCICLDKCGCCELERDRAPDNSVGYGIAVGMALKQ